MSVKKRDRLLSGPGAILLMAVKVMYMLESPT